MREQGASSLRTRGYHVRAKLLAKLPRNSAKPRGYSYVHWCRDEDMFADPLTKVANKHKYLKFTKVFFNIRD